MGNIAPCIGVIKMDGIYGTIRPFYGQCNGVGNRRNGGARRPANPIAEDLGSSEDVAQLTDCVSQRVLSPRPST